MQSLAAVMRQSSITELDLDLGDVSVRLRRPTPDHDGGEMRLENQPLAQPNRPAEILITAPMIGTFYAAATPEPSRSWPRAMRSMLDRPSASSKR